MEIPPLSEGVVTGDVRMWLRAEGLAAFALSLLVYWRLGGSWWLFVALFLVPDLSMLGYLISGRVGGLAYNIVHSYLLPLGIAIVAFATNRIDVLSLLCIWTGHIGLDRFFGYGLKYPSAFKRTHLGILGKMPG
jgi:hypothetical protein